MNDTKTIFVQELTIIILGCVPAVESQIYGEINKLGDAKDDVI